MKKVDWVILGGLLALCYGVFFHHLDEFALRLWDEGRNGTNALEMVKNGNWLVPHFRGEPDMWNVKPPLHIWLVALSFKILGINELALRLPSAICASLVVVLIYVFAAMGLKRRWAGLMGGLIILSSMGFSDTHIGRTGDYDALLTLFVFGGGLGFFWFLETGSRRARWVTILGFTAGVLTKGVAGLMMAPGMAIYWLLSGKIRALVGDRRWWMSMIGGVGIIASYYLSREAVNSGYLAAVWREDVAGRFLNDVGSGGNDFWYYFKLWESFRFQKWIYAIPLSLVVLGISRDKLIKKWVGFSLLTVTSYFLVISLSQTKQFWYDAPLYPWTALLAGVTITEIIGRLPWWSRVVPIIIFAFYTQRYVRTNLAYIHRPDLDKNEACLKYGYLFRDQTINKNGFKGIHQDEWCSPAQFYLEANGVKRIKIEQIRNSDKVLTCDSVTLGEIEKVFDNKRLWESNNGCWGMLIGERRLGVN